MKQALIDLTLRHPKWVAPLAVLMSLALISGVRFVHFEDDIMKMLPSDMPSRIIWNEVEEQFGATEPLLLAIGGDGPIVSPQKLALIWDLTRQLEDNPAVDEVLSLASMTRIDNVDGFMEVGDLMPSRDLSPAEITRLTAYLQANPEIGERLLSTDGTYATLAVVPATSASDEDLATALEDVLALIPEGLDINMAGMPYIRGVLSKTVRKDVFNLIRIGMVILALILLINLRSAPGLMMVLAVIGLSTGSMIGFFGWVYRLTGSDAFNFTLLNSSMPIILLTIATADGVHIITRFFREMRVRQDVQASVRATMDVLMMPIFLTSITTMAGFISLVTTPLRAMTGYGVAISFGIFWAWVLSVTLLPSLMTLAHWNLSGRALTSAGMLERIVHKLSGFVFRRPKTILAAGSLLIVVSLMGATLVRVEVNFVTFFKPTSPIRQSIEFIDDHFAGSLNLALEVTGDIKAPASLTAMESIQSHLEREDYIGSTLSLANIIRKLHRTVMDDSAQYEIIPDTRAKVANLLTLYSMSGDPDDFSALVDYDYQRALITATVKQTSTSGLVGIVNRTRDYLDDLPDNGLQVRLTGFPVFIQDFVQVLIVSSFRSLSVSLILVIALSWIFFKSLRWGLLAVLPLGSAIILNFGLMGWFGLALNHVTALLTAIIIGVGVDFAVHFVAQYRHLLKSGIPRDEVGLATINDVGYPILLNVLAVSVGFSTLLFSEFVPMAYMGGLVIISMVSCAVGTLTILATLTHLMREKVSA